MKYICIELASSITTGVKLYAHRMERVSYRTAESTAVNSCKNEEESLANVSNLICQFTNLIENGTLMYVSQSC